MYNFGYACVAKNLKDSTCNSTCRISTLEKLTKNQQFELLKIKSTRNLLNLVKILKYNKENNISFFRITSHLFPFKTHPVYGYDWFPRETLKNIGKMIKDFGIRVTFHADQFNVLNSEKEDVVLKTIKELDTLSEIFDIMKLDYNSVIIIHGGNSKDTELKRFFENFYKLKDSTQKRLVIENCEFAFSIESLLKHVNNRIPICFDFHHYFVEKELVVGKLSCDDKNYLFSLIPKILESWNTKRPKFHVSSTKFPDSLVKTQRRKHSDLIDLDTKEFLKEFISLGPYGPYGFDLMIEAKSKELALFDLRNYFGLLKIE